MDTEEPKTNVHALRDPVTNRFIKGGCGNPTGTRGALRDAANVEKLSVEQMYRAHAPEVFEALLKLIRAKDIAPTAKINAIKEFNSRALGSPTATTVIKSSAQQDADDVDLSDLTDDILRQVVDRSNKH